MLLQANYRVFIRLGPQLRPRYRKTRELFAKIRFEWVASVESRVGFPRWNLCAAKNGAPRAPFFDCYEDSVARVGLNYMQIVRIKIRRSDRSPKAEGPEAPLAWFLGVSIPRLPARATAFFGTNLRRFIGTLGRSPRCANGRMPGSEPHLRNPHGQPLSVADNWQWNGRSRSILLVKARLWFRNLPK